MSNFFSKIYETIKLHAVDVLLPIALSIIAAVIVCIVFGHLMKKTKAHRMMLRVIRTCIIAGVAISVAEHIPGVNTVTKTLLASSGVLAVAISFSAQNSISNIISGLFISWFKPFKIGDRIKLVSNDITGIVEEITLRHTILKTFTNTRVVVPNATMNETIVENSDLIDCEANGYIDVEIAYDADIDKAMALLSGIIENHGSYIGEKPVAVQVRALGESGVALRASMRTKNVNENFAACSDARYKILKEFAVNGIEIPYPHRTVLVKTE